jgi:phage minor structural protein
MFGDINLEKLKPRKPQLSLCKPDLTTIAKLSEAYNINHTTRLADLNELVFAIPYYTEIRKEMVINPHVEVMRERFLIKVKLGKKIEYYVITEINDSSNEEDVKEVKAVSLGYQLRDKIVEVYEEVGVTAKQAVTEALSKTNWSIGSNLSNPEHFFNRSASTGGAGGRSYNVTSKTALDFLIEVAESFNALIVWDTVNKVVDFELPTNVGGYKGLKISYGKYLQSLGRESSTDEMVTRLTPIGSEGLTIHSYNPTGSGFIEDFSYFMYPFKRDDFGNTVQSSHYMSDELCHAILNYKEKVEGQRTEFSDLLNLKTLREAERTDLENELFSLLTEYYIIDDKITAKKSISEYEYLTFIHNEVAGEDTRKREFISHNEDANYVLMAYNHTNTTNYFTVDGFTKSIPVGQWFVVDRKPVGSTETMFESVGSDYAEVELIVCSIDQWDYDNATDLQLIESYNTFVKEDALNDKEVELNAKRDEIATIDSQIANLNGSLSIEQNFSPAQIVERNEYIIEKQITNDSLTSAEELFKFGTEEFEKLREPQVVLELDIINFLEVVEAWKDWDKLTLGDEIKIHHERLGIDVTAKVIEIEYDYEQASIKLTIANVKDIKTDEDKLIDALYGAVSTSTTVDASKFKWNKVEGVEGKVSSILDEPWDVTKRMIQSADGDVVWDRGGFKIISKSNPDEFLVATSGVLAITRSGGKNWEHAITTKGIIGERIIGKLLIGENLIIQNQSGSFTIDDNGFTISQAQFRLVAEDGTDFNIGAEFDRLDNYIGTVKTDLQGEIGDVRDSVGSLELSVNTTFRDGVIDDAEKLAIKTHIDQLNSEKSDIDKRYTNIYSNPYLIDEVGVTTAKADLLAKKDDFNLKHTDLINAINTAIADASVIDDERANVDSKFLAYNVSLGTISEAFENALDNISLNKAKEAEGNAINHADELKALTDADVNAVAKDVGDLGVYVDGSFKDGVISEAEKLAIAEHLKSLNAEKSDLDERYTQVYSNVDLDGTEKTSLASAKTNYNTSHTNLVDAINTAIADSQIIADERANVESKFMDYATKLGALATALEVAINKISENKKASAMSYADGLKQLLDVDIADVDKKVGNLDTYVDGAFKDGVIQEAEARAIEKYINSLEAEKADVDNRYTGVVNNEYLKTSSIRSLLTSAKTNYDTVHSGLISSITTAIADSKATATEKATVDTEFAKYKEKLAILSDAFEQAIDDIGENKTNSIKRYDGTFELGKAFWSTEYYGKDVPATTNGGVSVVSGTGSIGGNVLRVKGSDWFYSRYAQPIDTSRTYRMRFRVRQTEDATTGDSMVYAGVATLDANYVPITGGAGTHRYFAVSSTRLTVAHGWKEYEGTITGVGDASNQFRPGTAYVRPMCIVNYSSGNGTVEIDMMEFEDITETLDGKSAWGKFSGAGNNLPAGSVAFGNGLSASDIEGVTVNFNGRNDRNSTTPKTPVVGATVGGTVVDSLDHTVNTDGSVDISFEWDFDTNGGFASDIDGFIVYVMQGASSGAYSFGTSPKTEQVYYVTPEKRALILYGVPANKYYTFGVQSYRIVDADINADGVLKSPIVKDTLSGHNPYRPSVSVAFNGSITGTIVDSTGASKNASEVADKALGSLQEGTPYNNITWDNNSGLVATRNDSIVRTVLNATSGIAIQKKESGVWKDKFYADTNGNLHLTGNITMTGGSISWANIAKPSYTANEVGARPSNWMPTASDVGATTETEVKRLIKPRVRYIRDWMNGNSVNTGNHWVEIQAWSGGTNRALNKPTTGSGGSTGIERVTDGDTATHNYYSGGSGLDYVRIDLGAIYDDIDYIQVYHYNADGRKYHETKLEVSEDGVNWTVLFDSAKSGEYNETSNGKTVPVNVHETISKSATYIDQNGIYTGNIGFNQAKGGTLQLGGGSNGNGVLDLQDSAGNTIVQMDNAGITLANGGKLIGGNGVVSMFVFETSGQWSGWSEFGRHNHAGSQIMKEMVCHVDIPPNFTVQNAEFELLSMPSYQSGYYRHTNNINVYYKYAQENGYWDLSDMEPMVQWNGASYTNITSPAIGGTWSPSGSSILKRTGSVTNYLTSNATTTFMVKSTTSIGSASIGGLGKIRIIVTGYYTG